MEPNVRENPAEQRFEMENPDGAPREDGDLAIVSYERDGDVVTLTHTFVPEALRGRGIAGKLIKASLDSLREQGLQVVPQCPTVVGYMKGHPETQDLLTPDARRAIAA
jgi:predicted GNAT family acetyltransferase